MARVYKNFLDALKHAPLSVKGEINVEEMVSQAGRTGRDPLELLLAKVKVLLDLNGMFDVVLSDGDVRALERYRSSLEATLLRSVMDHQKTVTELAADEETVGKSVIFATSKTKKGCWAIATWPSGRRQKKFFRDGQMRGERSALNWIKEQVECFRDLPGTEHLELPKFWLNDKEWWEEWMRRTPVVGKKEIVRSLPSRAIQIQAVVCSLNDFGYAHVRIYALCADGSVWVRYDANSGIPFQESDGWRMVDGGVS